MSVKQLSTVSTVSPSDDIWFPVQVNGEWLWKKIAKSSLTTDEAADYTWTGKHSFDITSGNYQLLTTDDPTFASPSYIFGIADHVSAIDHTSFFDARYVNYADNIGYHCREFDNGVSQVYIGAKDCGVGASYNGAYGFVSFEGQALKLPLEMEYANLAAISAVISTPTQRMMVYVTGQGLAYYTGDAWVSAADGTTLIT